MEEHRDPTVEECRQALIAANMMIAQLNEYIDELRTRITEMGMDDGFEDMHWMELLRRSGYVYES